MPRGWRPLAALCFAALAVLAGVPRAGAEEGDAPAGPKPIKLTVDSLESTLQALPSDCYVLIEMFACVAARAQRAQRRARSVAPSAAP
jgi:hypothetical protein